MTPAFDPLLPWPLLITSGGIVALALVALAWRGSAGVPPRSRAFLLALRLLALVGVIALLANPGRWRASDDMAPPEWGLLIDGSGSMATPDAGAGTTRTAAAERFASALLAASKHPDRIHAHRFDESLGSRWGEGEEAPLSDAGSRLDRAAAALLDRAAGADRIWTGLVVLGDGRQTSDDGVEIEALATKARSLGVPVHVVPFGGDVPRQDLRLTLPRRQFLTLPNQTVTVAARVENEGLPPLRVELRLLQEDGKEIGKLDLDVATGETVPGEFTLPPDAPAGRYRVEVTTPGEDRHPANNREELQVTFLEERTRVFLIEGAPYWDTKFLAQLLREQGQIDVDAVYRIRPDRFYRVSTAGDGETPFEATDEVFPDSDAALGRYDLVVVGKGAESFLTGERLERLVRFVKDRGGAVLLSRGKPYAGEVPGFEALEPGRWGEETRAEYRFLPTNDGEGSGLFGERLPVKESAVWSEMPPLEDVRSMAELRPFTRVLATGERVGGGAKVPLLLARRHGRGLVAAINGDGLWRWGFRPEGGEDEEDWHREFWMQLLQWAATYSEFLPGEDFSLRLEAETVREGGGVRARIGYRGANPEPAAPKLKWSGPASGEIVAASAGKGEDGAPRWGAILSPETPGSYLVQLVDGERVGPSLPLTVLPRPGEQDELSADRETLARLAEASGGQAWTEDGIGDLVALLEPEAKPSATAEAEWEPLWNQPWILGGIVFLFGVEWAARRRLGLI